MTPLADDIAENRNSFRFIRPSSSTCGFGNARKHAQCLL